MDSTNQLGLYGGDGLPPHQHTDTSRDAAASFSHKVGRLQRQVYEYILSKGSYGATDFEIDANLRDENEYTLRPRRCECVKMGWIVRTKERRTSPHTKRRAIVWVAVPEEQRQAKTTTKRIPCSYCGGRGFNYAHQYEHN